MESAAQPWGTFAPPRSSSVPFRLLIALGISRGAVRKQILRAWRRRHGPLADVTYKGVRYRLDTRDNLTDRKILASSRRPDHAEIRVLAKHTRGGAFIDVGANIGYYSLSLCEMGAARAVAIEPHPQALARLRYNVRINGMQHRISVVSEAAGRKGSLDLRWNSDLGGASVLRNAHAGGSQVQVRSRTLVEILRENSVTQTGGLKIDIEGFEDRALIPFFRSAPMELWPKCVVIEHIHAERWQNDPIALMTGKGYRRLFRTRNNTALHKA